MEVSTKPEGEDDTTPPAPPSSRQPLAPSPSPQPLVVSGDVPTTEQPPAQVLSLEPLPRPPGSLLGSAPQRRAPTLSLRRLNLTPLVLMPPGTRGEADGPVLPAPLPVQHPLAWATGEVAQKDFSTSPGIDSGPDGRMALFRDPLGHLCPAQDTVATANAALPALPAAGAPAIALTIAVPATIPAFTGAAQDRSARRGSPARQLLLRPIRLLAGVGVHMGAGAPTITPDDAVIGGADGPSLPQDAQSPAAGSPPATAQDPSCLPAPPGQPRTEEAPSVQMPLPGLHTLPPLQAQEQPPSLQQQPKLDTTPNLWQPQPQPLAPTDAMPVPPLPALQEAGVSSDGPDNVPDGAAAAGGGSGVPAYPLVAVGMGPVPGLPPPQLPESPVEVTVAVRVGAAGPRRARGAGGSRQVADDDVRAGYVRGVCGQFNVGRYLADRDCILYQNKWLSRSHFEKVGGSKMAKWYKSIRVTSSLEPLGEWLERHGMPVARGPSRRSSKRPADGADLPPLVQQHWSAGSGAEAEDGYSAATGPAAPTTGVAQPPLPTAPLAPAVPVSAVIGAAMAAPASSGGNDMDTAGPADTDGTVIVTATTTATAGGVGGPDKVPTPDCIPGPGPPSLPLPPLVSATRDERFLKRLLNTLSFTGFSLSQGEHRQQTLASASPIAAGPIPLGAATLTTTPPTSAAAAVSAGGILEDSGVAAVPPSVAGATALDTAPAMVGPHPEASPGSGRRRFDTSWSRRRVLQPPGTPCASEAVTPQPTPRAPAAQPSPWPETGHISSRPYLPTRFPYDSGPGWVSSAAHGAGFASGGVPSTVAMSSAAAVAGGNSGGTGYPFAAVTDDAAEPDGGLGAQRRCAPPRAEPGAPLDPVDTATPPSWRAQQQPGYGGGARPLFLPGTPGLHDPLQLSDGKSPLGSAFFRGASTRDAFYRGRPMPYPYTFPAPPAPSEGLYILQPVFPAPWVAERPTPPATATHMPNADLGLGLAVGLRRRRRPAEVEDEGDLLWQDVVQRQQLLQMQHQQQQREQQDLALPVGPDHQPACAHQKQGQKQGQQSPQLQQQTHMGLGGPVEDTPVEVTEHRMVRRRVLRLESSSEEDTAEKDTGESLGVHVR